MRYCTPRQFADNGHGVHVDTVASHLLRFIYRMRGVADVDGYKTPSHIDMQVFVRYAEMHDRRVIVRMMREVSAPHSINNTPVRTSKSALRRSVVNVIVLFIM